MMVALRLAGVFLLLACAGPAWAGRIWLNPSNRVADDKDLVVTVEGLVQGQAAAVTIQGDCGSGGPKRSAQCPALWGPETTEPQGSQPSLRFTIPPGKLKQLPRDRVLWVVVEAPGWPRPAISRFHRADPCTTLATLFQTFTGGRCTLGLPQVLSELTRSGDGLADKIFEVQRLALTDPNPRPVPGTRGATGVAWSSAREIWVTSATGLTRINLATGATAVVLKAGDRPLAAPLVLPTSRRQVAFVRQTPGPQRLADPESVAELEIWPGGRRLALPYKVHQLLAADREGSRFLALSLGLNDTAPLLFAIDLRRGTIDPLGFDPRLYQTLLRRPKSEQSAVAFEEVRSGHWRIGLAKGNSYERDLAVFPDRNALAPAWSPDGSEIAFLAEVRPDSPTH